MDSRFSLLTGGRQTSPPRHQTLRAAIEWSYDLLSESEQVVFRRLSVFAGSFTLEAAESICVSQEIRREEVLTLLGRLVDKSLLNVEPAASDSDLATRYRLLDTLRSFGRLKLAETGETRWMRDRHAVYYMHLAEAADPEFLVQNQFHWFKLLQAESDNIRAVVEWGTESGQAESALRIVGASLWFWFSIGSIREGLELAVKALAVPSGDQLPDYRARALNTAGYLQWRVGYRAAARQSLEEAMEIMRASGDESSLAWALQFLGRVLSSEGEYELADNPMKEGVAIVRKLGDFTKSSISLSFRGDIALQQGDRSEAKAVYEECVGLLRMSGNKLFLAYPLRRLGYLSLDRNEIETAKKYFRESLALNREGGDICTVAACLIRFAALAVHLDKPILAARLYGVVERWLDSLSFLLILDQAELARLRDQLRIRLDEVAFEAARLQGWELSEEQAIKLVEQLLGEED